MKAIITGATGFIGKWLVEELYQTGFDITVIVHAIRNVPDAWKGKIAIVKCDIDHYKDLQKFHFQYDDYDFFFHLAWIGTSGAERADFRLQLKNSYAACEAVSLAKRLSCRRFINAGSIMEYEAMDYIPRDGTEPSAGYMYSISKLTANFMAKTLAVQENIEYINIIISNIFGAGEKSARFLNQLLRKMIYNQKILLTNGEQLYDFIYVTDAVKGIILAAQKGINCSSYYIGNQDQQPLKQYILQVKDILKSDSELAFGKVIFKGSKLTYKEFNTQKLYDMGFKIEIPFKKGILLTAESIRKEGLADEF
jgi:NAD dependent epimerase/dehydratase family.